MNVLTVYVPAAATAEIVEHIQRVGGSASPVLAEPALVSGYLPLPPMVTRTPEEQAQDWEILQRGGDPDSIETMIRWYEEDRQDRLLPGRE